MEPGIYPPGQEDRIEAAFGQLTELGVNRYEIERWQVIAASTSTIIQTAAIIENKTGLGGILGLFNWLVRPPGPTRNLALPLMLIGSTMGYEARTLFEDLVEAYDELNRTNPTAAEVLRIQVLWRLHPDADAAADAAATKA